MHELMRIGNNDIIEAGSRQSKLGLLRRISRLKNRRESYVDILIMNIRWISSRLKKRVYRDYYLTRIRGYAGIVAV
jgi:hypothetical protein